MSRAQQRIVRWLAVAISSVLVVGTLGACVPLGNSAKTTVGTDGFTIAISGASASGPAGVVAPGTSVRMEAIDAPIPREVAAFAQVAGAAVSLTLNGSQPLAPVEVAFDVSEGADSDLLFVIGEDAASGTGVSFVESSWDAAEEKLVASVEHLSWFAPVKVDTDKLSDRVAAWINQSLGTRSAKPSCFGSDPDLEFSSVTDNIAWPCVSESTSGVEWSLQSNSGLVWEILTQPKAAYKPLTALSVTGLATIETVRLIGDGLEGDTVLLPLETLRGSLRSGQSATFALQVEPGLSQVATLVWGLSMIFPSKWLDIASNGECMVGVVKAGTSALSGETIHAVLSCMASVLKGAGGKLFGILLTGPALLSTQLEGLAREIARTNTVQFTLGYRDDNQLDSLPAGATWLYGLSKEGTYHSGLKDSAAVPVGDNEVVFENSTTVWVGCNGEVSKTSFYLDADESELSFSLGLQDIAPEGMSAEFLITAIDDEHRRFIFPETYAAELGRWTVTRGEPLDRQSISLDGFWVVTIYAATDSPCGDSDEGYAALLDSYVK